MTKTKRPKHCKMSYIGELLDTIWVYKKDMLPPGSLPEFIIPGAQKSGTTSLFEYITDHPKVIPPSGKESHYFDNNFFKPVLWYRRKFPSHIRKLYQNGLTGEATPYYLFHPLSPSRIYSLIPNVKLIILLRNPIDRAISHYWMEFERGNESLPMDEAFSREKERLSGEEAKLINGEESYSFPHQRHSYLSRGIYADQLDRYRKFFSDDQILIIQSERLFKDTKYVMKKVFDFLELRYKSFESKKYNEGNKSKEVECDLVKKLKIFYEFHNERLYDITNISRWW